MSYFLRAVKRPRWKIDASIETKGDLPAEPLMDLNAIGNNLSIWLLPISDESSDELKKIATALVTQRDFISVFDCVVMELKYLEEIGIEIAVVDGDTPYLEINSRHRDLTNVSAQQLLDLAYFFKQYGTFYRYSKSTMQQLAIDAFQEGKLDVARITKIKMLTKLVELTNKDITKIPRLESVSIAHFMLAQELEQRNLLYCTSVTRFGISSERRTEFPNFLIHSQGKWGVLIISEGKQVSSPISIDGIDMVTRIDSDDCVDNRERIVDDFLQLLQQS